MSVTAILRSSPELEYLAKYTESGSGPPPPNTSLDIWSHVAHEVLPGTLRYHLEGVPANQRPLRSFQVLAKAARLVNATVMDAKSPSEEVWRKQISELNAFLAFRNNFRKQKYEYITKSVELVQRQQQLHSEVDSLDSEWNDLDAESVRSHYRNNAELIGALSGRIETAQKSRQDLSDRIIKHNTNATALTKKVESIQQQTTGTLEHADLLQLVAKDGYSQLQSKVTQLESDVANLQSRHSRQESLLQQYKYTMHVFDELIPTLHALLKVEEDVISRKDERRNMELTQLRPLKLKLVQLTQQVAASAQEIEQRKSKIQELRETIESLDHQLAAEPELPPVESQESEREHETINEEEIAKAESELADLDRHEHDLNLLLKTQRKWLHAVIEVENQGKRLFEENDRIRRWMTEYLDIHK